MLKTMGFDNEERKFETMPRDDAEEFYIGITEESDWSPDGGHTFEDVTSAYYLNKDEAKELIAELQKFVGD